MKIRQNVVGEVVLFVKSARVPVEFWSKHDNLPSELSHLRMDLL
jgi:hypothetical protein